MCVCNQLKTLYKQNNSYYNQGYSKGVAEALNSSLIQYVYHEHTGNSSSGGGCYGKIVYKTTQVLCGSTNKYVSGSYESGGTTHYYYTCNVCGKTTTSGAGACKGYITVTTSDIDHYELNCGKTTGTIESATITFN